MPNILVLLKKFTKKVSFSWSFSDSLGRQYVKNSFHFVEWNKEVAALNDPKLETDPFSKDIVAFQ